MLNYINKVEQEVEAKLSRAIKEEENRRYTQTLSECLSLISVVKEFLKRFSAVEAQVSGLRCTRLCFRWIFGRDDNVVFLTKLKPKISISFDGAKVKISHGNITIAISTNEIEYSVNQLRDRAPLGQIYEVVNKSSLLLRVLGKTKSALTKYMDDFPKCAKVMR